MKKNVFVFIPNTLEKYKTGYLEGCYKQFQDCEAYYITNEVVSTYNNNCIGYMGRCFKSHKYKIYPCLFIHSSSNKVLIVDDCGTRTALTIIYNYQEFKNSDIIYRECDNYGKHFKIIADELKKSSTVGSTNGKKGCLEFVILVIIFIINFILKITVLVEPLLSYSATFLHFEESTLNLIWFLKDIIHNRKLLPKTGNLFVAKILDLLIGILLLNWCLKYENDILNFIETEIEAIITNLKGLLLYLMGSPIGLKLNYSLNNTLGKFFFYHISLWRIFLQGTEPFLKTYFKFLFLPGALGFSFQIAMLSDLISITTFHIYCIYVYAARLFSLQIKGLISLWRLFIGRKLNPLRHRVDSCRYTPDQLFIGTLGFTILLFLLPTTAMYYAVFTTFRLAILCTNGLLLRVRFLLNIVPLYVITLWIFNSSSLAGTVYITWKNNEADEITVFTKLKTLPLKTSIEKSVPDSVKFIEGKSYRCIFHNVFTGIFI